MSYEEVRDQRRWLPMTELSGLSCEDYVEVEEEWELSLVEKELNGK